MEHCYSVVYIVVVTLYSLFTTCLCLNAQLHTHTQALITKNTHNTAKTLVSFCVHPRLGINIFKYIRPSFPKLCRMEDRHVLSVTEALKASPAFLCIFYKDLDLGGVQNSDINVEKTDIEGIII